MTLIKRWRLLKPSGYIRFKSVRLISTAFLSLKFSPVVFDLPVSAAANASTQQMIAAGDARPLFDTQSALLCAAFFEPVPCRPPFCKHNPNITRRQTLTQERASILFSGIISVTLNDPLTPFIGNVWTHSFGLREVKHFKFGTLHNKYTSQWIIIP